MFKFDKVIKLDDIVYLFLKDEQGNDVEIPIKTSDWEVLVNEFHGIRDRGVGKKGFDQLGLNNL
jgi:hypothetical protein